MQGAWLMIARAGAVHHPADCDRSSLIYAVAGAALCRDLVVGRHPAAFGAWPHLAGVCDCHVAIAANGIQWLAAGIGVRGVLSLGEVVRVCAAGGTARCGPAGGLVAPAGMFLSASSSFDTAAEWLMVLGCVLAVSDRSRRELQDANRDLVAAQEDLRRLADRDPLTGAGQSALAAATFSGRCSRTAR